MMHRERILILCIRLWVRLFKPDLQEAPTTPGGHMTIMMSEGHTPVTCLQHSSVAVPYPGGGTGALVVVVV